MIRILYFRRKCIGCNYCVEVAPDRWRMSLIDGKCSLIGSSVKKGIYRVEVHDDEEEQVSQVSQNCPVKVIWSTNR